MVLKRLSLMYKRILCQISPKYKLKQVCRVLDFQPDIWQRQFALHGTCDVPFPRERRSGKP